MKTRTFVAGTTAADAPPAVRTDVVSVAMSATVSARRRLRAGRGFGTRRRTIMRRIIMWRPTHCHVDIAARRSAANAQFSAGYARRRPRGECRLVDMSSSTLTRACTRFPSAVLVAVGLAAGFGIAQGTGIRALGGVVFVGAGLAAGRLWLRRRGLAVALGLAALYLAAFVLAHVLALGVGLPAWLAVSLVTLAA